MLAQTERQSHDNGSQELSPLLDQITPPDSRPKIVLDNLCEQAVRGREGTDSDSSSSLLALWNSMKELPKIIQGGSHQNLIKMAGWNLKYWYSYDLADDLRINYNHMPLNRRLKDNATILILHNL